MGCRLQAGTDARLIVHRVATSDRPNRMSRSGDSAVRFVDEHEVLVHPLGIDRSFKHEQILRPDQTMLHSGLKMKPVARSERLYGKRLAGSPPRQDKPRPFPHLQVFVLLLVHLESEVSASTDYEILFDPRVLMQNDDHTSPRRLYGPFGALVDAVEKFRKTARSFQRAPLLKCSLQSKHAFRQ